MNKFVCLLALLILNACHYGVNSTVTTFATVESECITSENLESLKTDHNISQCLDSSFIKKYASFQNERFENLALYFDESPEEIIGLRTDLPKYRLAYVFNPNISSRIVSNTSGVLTEKDKKRILFRVQKSFIKYQCEEGKKKSYLMLYENGIILEDSIKSKYIDLDSTVAQ